MHLDFPGGSVRRKNLKKKKEEERICLPTQETQETGIRLLGWEDPLEEGMATPSSILAWKVPWKRSLVGHSPQGHEESDMTEHTRGTMISKYSFLQ